jgi:hypothetical protein
LILLAKQLQHLLRRQRPAEEVALHLVALEQPEEIQLFLGLDPFGNDFESEGMGERNDR